MKECHPGFNIFVFIFFKTDKYGFDKYKATTQQSVPK